MKKLTLALLATLGCTIPKPASACAMCEMGKLCNYTGNPVTITYLITSDTETIPNGVCKTYSISYGTAGIPITFDSYPNQGGYQADTVVIPDGYSINMRCNTSTGQVYFNRVSFGGSQ